MFHSISTLTYVDSDYVCCLLFLLLFVTMSKGNDIMFWG